MARLEPFYDSVMDDYDDEDDASTSSGLKKLGVSLGLRLRPWEGCGVRSAKSEVSLIDFTDDSFSSTTPSPLTETQQPDEDTLKVYSERWKHPSHQHDFLEGESEIICVSSSGRPLHPGLASSSASVRRGFHGDRRPIRGPGGALHQQGIYRRDGGSSRGPDGQERVTVS